MKKKVIVFMILIALFVPFVANVFYSVKAYSGEIDQSKITLPMTIFINNNKGTGTLILSSDLTGYTISYQKINITKEKYDSIMEKQEELNDFIDEKQEEKTERENNLNELQQEYNEIFNDENSTQEDIDTARSNYETAYQEYEEFCDSATAEAEQLQNEYNNLIPDYKENTGTINVTSPTEIKLDFTGSTGKVYFVLWVSASNGTNTYRNFGIYSSDIKDSTGESSNDNNSESIESLLVDFNLYKNGNTKAILEVSGLEYNVDCEYYLFITTNTNKPNVTSTIYDEKIELRYDEETGTFKTTNQDKLSKYIELNQDLYATILKKSDSEETIIVYGKKLTRFDEPKFADSFFLTFLSYDSLNISMNLTHSPLNSNRKMQIKVGKITDIELLKKIKNNEIEGFSDLLSYAKSHEGIYDEILDSDSDYKIAYSEGFIDLDGLLQDEEYYYLYVKTDDENGKYLSNECVTLARASVYSDTWHLLFYDSSNFTWEDWSVSPVDLPNTGLKTVILVSVTTILLSVGIVSFIKCKKYKF